MEAGKGAGMESGRPATGQLMHLRYRKKARTGRAEWVEGKWWEVNFRQAELSSAGGLSWVVWQRGDGTSLEKGRGQKLGPQAQFKGNVFSEDILLSPISSLLSKNRELQAEIWPAPRGQGLPLLQKESSDEGMDFERLRKLAGFLKGLRGSSQRVK
ncbi:hypothetical protein Cadr_000006157 [Camelus dromedarius]|uniref:Uncharacterized protein n=1 Tax=Camelus dromedarius TaxID=9838 RepID=A0A5N4E1N7_CAMDR|nr:hypothetical protein Cadr_000006157 [Camelus dromedarius]